MKTNNLNSHPHNFFVDPDNKKYQNGSTIRSHNLFALDWSCLKFISSMFHQNIKTFFVFNKTKNLHHNHFSQILIYSRNWLCNNYKAMLIFQFQVSGFSSYGSFIIIGALIFIDNLKIQCCLSSVIIILSSQ
jgi:hypothetical protein